MEKYKKLDELAKLVNTRKKNFALRLSKAGIPLYQDVDGDDLIDYASYARIEEEITYFMEDCWSLSETAELLGVAPSTVTRFHRNGFLDGLRCKWTSSRMIRFTQDQIGELLYRLEFADPEWRRTSRINLLGLLQESKDRFPGVDEYEKWRKKFF